jgi:hypothetical protein
MPNLAIKPALVHARMFNADDSKIVLGLFGTEYQLHLGLAAALPQSQASVVTGVIQARAQRVDIVETGGRYIEPLQGQPRRIQGTLVAADPGANTITIACAPDCCFVCELTAGQRAADLPVGALVAFELEGAASFQPM